MLRIIVLTALPLPRLNLPAMARLAALLAAAAAVGVWGALLGAPQPGQLPPALSVAPSRQADVSPVALWFGRDGVLQTEVAVVGLIAGGDSGAALLSVNGGPPVGVRTGQEVAPQITLVSVDAAGVMLDMGGTRTRLAAPPLGAPPDGIRVQP
ncbi:hypothetical protein [Bordetella sp. 2513F-2]